MSVKRTDQATQVSMISIAKALGVSQGTVSRVLAGTYPRYRIAESTAERVRAAALEAGYRPHAGAMAMRRNRFNAIGVLASETMIRGASLSLTLRGINDVLAEEGKSLSIAILPEGDSPSSLTMLDVHGVDGLLVGYPAPSWVARRIVETTLPTIWVNVDDTLEANSLCFDDELGARTATEHVISLGHRRIGYFNAREATHFSVARRLAGYEDAMRCAGLTPDADAGHLIDIDRCEHMMERLSGRNRPTAAVCYSGTVAMTAIRAAHYLHLRVPDQLSVISLDNPVYDIDLCPPLTGMRPPRYDVGQQAAAALLSLIENPSQKLKPRLFAPQLAVQESTAAAPEEVT